MKIRVVTTHEVVLSPEVIAALSPEAKANLPLVDITQSAHVEPRDLPTLPVADLSPSSLVAALEKRARDFHDKLSITPTFL